MPYDFSQSSTWTAIIQIFNNFVTTYFLLNTGEDYTYNKKKLLVYMYINFKADLFKHNQYKFEESKKHIYLKESKNFYGEDKRWANLKNYNIVTEKIK